MEPFPRCDMCGINIPTGRLIRNLRTARCGRNMQMRLRRRDVEITASFMGATFSLVGDDGADFFEGVESLNYLRRVLHQLDEDSLAVFQNVSRSKQVWGRLGKFLQWEGADLSVSEKFYHAVVQAVLLFGQRPGCC